MPNIRPEIRPGGLRLAFEGAVQSASLVSVIFKLTHYLIYSRSLGGDGEPRPSGSITLGLLSVKTRTRVERIHSQ
jgi:hypothetical protein